MCREIWQIIWQIWGNNFDKFTCWIFICLLAVLQDLRIHNVGSWSNLANAASMKVNKPRQAQRTSSSFEMFRKAALEKEERVSIKEVFEHYFFLFVCFFPFLTINVYFFLYWSDKQDNQRKLISSSKSCCITGGKKYTSRLRPF